MLRSAVMKSSCILNSSKDNFIKESLHLSTCRKLSILLNFRGVFLTLKCETLVFFYTIAIELSHFCLTFEEFCLCLTFSLGRHDPKRFGRTLLQILQTIQNILNRKYFKILPLKFSPLGRLQCKNGNDRSKFS